MDKVDPNIQKVMVTDSQCTNLNESISQIKELIDKHFQIIKNLLKFNKEKDANVSKLSLVLQKYREGFDVNMFKAVALHVISFREDTKKAYREFNGKDLPIDTVQKYLGYIVMDFEDLLGNIGIESVDGEWRFNGKNLNREICGKIEFSEPETFEIIDSEEVEVKTFEDLVVYIKSVETQITAILKNNAERDKLLNSYIEYSSIYEAGIQQATLYPVIRKIIGTYEQTKAMIDTKAVGLTAENCSATYILLLQTVVDATETILDLCNIIIDSNVSDIYDPKKQRILKMIATDDESKNGSIATRHTDCYLIDEKVIYPQKVDVYKK